MRNKLKDIPEPVNLEEYLAFFNALGLKGLETNRFVEKLMDSPDLAGLRSAHEWALRLVKNLHTQNLQRKLGHLIFDYLFYDKRVEIDYQVIPEYVREFFMLQQLQ